MRGGEKVKINLLQYRKEFNITQEELAKKLNTTHATINRYENGVSEPDLKTLKDLSKIFNVTTDELLGLQTKKETSTEEVEVLGTDQRAIAKLASKLDDAQASQVYNYMLFVIDQKNQKLQNFDF